jgi:hypothetical protein
MMNQSLRGALRAAVAALAAAALLLPQTASAWGLTGHRVVGEVAQSLLTTQARMEVAAILENEDLAEASNWPDFMKASPETFWREEASPLHYVTVPPGKTYADVGPPPEGDAVSALTRFRAQVLDRGLPKAQRALALRFIIHVVGDLHQPMHVGDGTDRGGNDVKVEFFGQPSNLHSIWDSGLIDRQQLSYTEMARWLMRGTDIKQAKAWMDPDPLTWVAESAAIRPALYPTSDKVSWDYAFAHDAILKQRLTQGGVRLAAYLNAMFGDPR